LNPHCAGILEPGLVRCLSLELFHQVKLTNYRISHRAALEQGDIKIRRTAKSAAKAHNRSQITQLAKSCRKISPLSLRRQNPGRCRVNIGKAAAVKNRSNGRNQSDSDYEALALDQHHHQIKQV